MQARPRRRGRAGRRYRRRANLRQPETKRPNGAACERGLRREDQPAAPTHGMRRSSSQAARAVRLLGRSLGRRLCRKRCRTRGAARLAQRDADEVRLPLKGQGRPCGRQHGSSSPSPAVGRQRAAGIARCGRERGDHLPRPHRPLPQQPAAAVPIVWVRVRRRPCRPGWDTVTGRLVAGPLPRPPGRAGVPSRFASAPAVRCGRRRRSSARP